MTHAETDPNAIVEKITVVVKQIYRDVKIHPFNNVILPEKFICPIVKKKLYPNDRSSIMY